MTTSKDKKDLKLEKVDPAEDGSKKEIISSKPKKTKKYRKQLPSVNELLINGAGDDEPQTFLQSLIYPSILLVVFLISLFIFHIAPHDKSVGHTKQTFGMNMKPKNKIMSGDKETFFKGVTDEH